MSADDKRTNDKFDDGLEELMNAFVGYDDKNDKKKDSDIVINLNEVEDSEPEKIELPENPFADLTLNEIPYEEVQLPEIERENVYEYDEYTDFDEFDDFEEINEIETIEEAAVPADEPKPQKPEKPKKEKKEKPKKDKKEKKEKANKPAKADSDKKKNGTDKAKKQDKAKNNAKSVKTEKTTAEEKPHEQESEQKPVSSVRLVTVLTVICAAVALLLATVNYFTETKIAENNAKAMLVSIREIFDESVDAEAVVYEENPDFTSVYLVMQDGDVCGYAASVAPNGFGGPINLVVGVDSAGTVMGVEVVSMSETPGLGSRVGNDDFLSRFKGAVGEVSVDVISGASISSKAVMTGVNSVSTHHVDLDTLAAKYGFLVVPYVRNEAVSTPVTEEITTEAPATEAPATVAPETEAPVTVAPVTEQAPPDVTKGDAPPQNIVKNPNDVNEGIHAEYEEDTAEYETLTTEPETTDPEETA